MRILIHFSDDRALELGRNVAGDRVIDFDPADLSENQRGTLRMLLPYHEGGPLKDELKIGLEPKHSGEMRYGKTIPAGTPLDVTEAALMEWLDGLANQTLRGLVELEKQRAAHNAELERVATERRDAEAARIEALCNVVRALMTNWSDDELITMGVIGRHIRYNGQDVDLQPIPQDSAEGVWLMATRMRLEEILAGRKRAEETAERKHEEAKTEYLNQWMEKFGKRPDVPSSGLYPQDAAQQWKDGLLERSTAIRYMADEAFGGLERFEYDACANRNCPCGKKETKTIYPGIYRIWKKLKKRLHANFGEDIEVTFYTVRPCKHADDGQQTYQCECTEDDLPDWSCAEVTVPVGPFSLTRMIDICANEA